MGYQNGLVWTDSSAVGLSPSWTIYTSAGAADRYLMLFLQAKLSDSAMSVTGGLLDKQLKKKKQSSENKSRKEEDK